MLGYPDNTNNVLHYVQVHSGHLAQIGRLEAKMYWKKTHLD